MLKLALNLKLALVLTATLNLKLIFGLEPALLFFAALRCASLLFAAPLFTLALSAACARLVVVELL